MQSYEDKDHTENDCYFDAHSDMLEFAIEERSIGKEAVLERDFLPGMAENNIDYRVAAISIPKQLLPEMALRRSLKMVALLHDAVDCTEELELATTSDDIATAPQSDAHTLIMGMEGAEPLQGEPDLLDVFHRLGLRLLTLTHARRNKLADGAFYTPRKTGTEGGITDIGVTVIERAFESGIVLDVSHLNETGFWDVIDIATEPIVASHSNCKAIQDVSRNLTDDQLQAVADTGGVIGLAIVGDFISDNPSLEDFLDHVDHAVDTVGIDHVGFGFDFADYLAKYRPSWDPENIPFGGTGVPRVEDDHEVKNLAPALRARGYTDEEVRKLTHQNFLGLFKTVLE